MHSEVLDPNVVTTAASAAEIIRAGGLIAVNFNGGFAFLGDCEGMDSAELIFRIKSRPREKTLSFVCAPKAFMPFVDQSRLRWPPEQIWALQTQAHALGTILPANQETVPSHLLVGDTVLNVWSEYAPLRSLFAAFHKLGGRSFHGASANLSGQPTLITIEDVQTTFGNSIDAIYADPQFAGPDDRRRSTSLLDLSGETPILRRSGNVPIAELQPLAEELGFGRIQLADTLKYV